jgi:Uma2 family endonuclease
VPVASIAAPGAQGSYTVDDLDGARQAFGTSHIELDPWGNLIVTPASDPHERAISILQAQLVRQLRLPDGCIMTGLPWRGASGYVNVPDLMVVAADWRRTDDVGLAPPPLLVVEVASPSTRAIDRGRKLDDYRAGGAGLYVRVDLPGLAPVKEPTFELHDFNPEGVMTAATDGLVMMVAEIEVRVDLSRLGA